MVAILLRLSLFILGIISVRGYLINIAFLKVNFSNMLTVAFGIMLIVIALFFNKIIQFTNKGFLKMLRISFFTLLFTFIIGFAIFFLYQNNHKNRLFPNNLDAIIILGAAINNDKPSLALNARLALGASYLKKNKDTIVVVSGGLGRGESYTEAYVMRNTLISMGIEEERILMEEEASSTKDNFAFSKTILNNYFDNEDFSCGFVTSDFHILRSEMIAKDNDLIANGIGTPSPKTMVYQYYFREYIATILYFITRLF